MNVISNKSFWVKVLLAILAIITLWLISGEDADKEKPNRVSRSSDYGMTNFKMTIMDKSGQPSQIIIGKEMAHYPADDSTEIISAVTEFIGQNNSIWLVSSDKATAQGKGEELLLTGNVIITRKEDDGIKMHTEKLHINTQLNTAYTDVAVTLKSPYGETNSVGLHTVLADKTINLHSRVKGHYDAP